LFCQQLNGCPDSAEEAQRWDRGLVFLLSASPLPIQILPSASMADSPALAAPLFVVVLLVDRPFRTLTLQNLSSR